MITRRLYLGTFVVTVIALSFASALAADTQQAVAGATHSAQAWLKLVDDGQYQESWNDAASFFKDHVSEPTWDAQVAAVRKPLGAVLSRTLKRAQYASALPGAPDGQYVVIQYDTSFQNKKSAIETVTPMLDSDGKWHVSGYYIK